MILEIITPEASIFNSEVESVSVPGINGSFQMLENHAPIVSLLNAGTISIKGGAIRIAKSYNDKFNKISNSEYEMNIDGGTIEMSNNKIIILAD